MAALDLHGLHGRRPPGLRPSAAVRHAHLGAAARRPRDQPRAYRPVVRRGTIVHVGRFLESLVRATTTPARTWTPRTSPATSSPAGTSAGPRRSATGTTRSTTSTPARPSTTRFRGPTAAWTSPGSRPGAAPPTTAVPGGPDSSGPTRAAAARRTSRSSGTAPTTTASSTSRAIAPRAGRSATRWTVTARCTAPATFASSPNAATLTTVLRYTAVNEGGAVPDTRHTVAPGPEDWWSVDVTYRHPIKGGWIEASVGADYRDREWNDTEAVLPRASRVVALRDPVDDPTQRQGMAANESSDGVGHRSAGARLRRDGRRAYRRRRAVGRPGRRAPAARPAAARRCGPAHGPEPELADRLVAGRAGARPRRPRVPARRRPRRGRAAARPGGTRDARGRRTSRRDARRLRRPDAVAYVRVDPQARRARRASRPTGSASASPGSSRRPWSRIRTTTRPCGRTAPTSR